MASWRGIPSVIAALVISLACVAWLPRSPAAADGPDRAPQEETGKKPPPGEGDGPPAPPAPQKPQDPDAPGTPGKGKEETMGDDAPKHTNRLAKEKSPYLLQHAHNPVDWYPWGDEAFEKAKKEDKPIFLSIGYSTCHWCHVMERESFENEEIAAYLKEHFVSIKVDREERPDVDQIYMNYLQISRGQGGWPLNVWLTPDRKPFFAGTYFPPESRGGMRGFPDVLEFVVKIWTEDRERVEKAAEGGVAALGELDRMAKPGDVGEEVLTKAYAELEKIHDAEWGGFGGAPKFPRPMDLFFLLRHHRRAKEAPRALPMVEKTLEMMWRGGMYDHIGGGFARYSTDHRWLVPHFEKMLYDNALLVRAYLEAHQITGEERYATIVREILGYVQRDMTHPDGGFYSAEDADSEGEEGKFYVWTPAQLSELLGKETAAVVGKYFGVSEKGNFEHGTSILHLPVHPDEFLKAEGLDAADWAKTLASARTKLFEAREKRIRPHLDDKIITAWNGLMISAFAFAHQVLGDEEYARAGRRAADFVLEKLQRDGRLLRSYRDGASVIGYINDYAFLTQGLLDLYEATFDERYYREALRLAEEMVRLFWDEEGKAFFFVGSDGPELVIRSKDFYDGAIPSGNAVAALTLLRLGKWTGEEKWRKLGEETLRSYGKRLADLPQAHPQGLCAVDFLLDTPKEVVLAGPADAEGMDALLRALHGEFLPNRVIGLVPPEGDAAPLVKTMPMLEGRPLQNGKPTAYVCENYACKLPTNDPKVLVTQLNE